MGVSSLPRLPALDDAVVTRENGTPESDSDILESTLDTARRVM
jgi:hypothetical protein